jgi:hypothetical protein
VTARSALTIGQACRSDWPVGPADAQRPRAATDLTTVVERSALSAAASRVRPTKSFFILAFSSSSYRQSLASEMSMPPNLAFPIVQSRFRDCVPNRSPYTSLMLAQTLIIWCSENLARFICPSEGGTLTSTRWKISRGSPLRLVCKHLLTQNIRDENTIFSKTRRHVSEGFV